MENPEFEKVLVTITNDINRTLKSNLGSYFKSIDSNNKVIDVLKSLLFTMPEYVNLKEEHKQLQNDYNTLKENYENFKSTNLTKSSFVIAIIIINIIYVYMFL